MKKTRKAISAPLGVIFGVLLAIILVVLATFIAFNISTKAVQSQGSQPVIVGTPVAFYYNSSGTLYVKKVSFTIQNPSTSTIRITGVYVGSQNASDITLTCGTASATALTSQATCTVEATFNNAEISSDDVAKGYIDIVIVTNTGTIKTAASLVQTVT